MTKADDLVRLRHMLDAARKATSLVERRERSDLDKDEMLALALVRLLEILGEAAKRVSKEVRADHPQVAWPAIAGTRDRLIHGYFEVDLDIVWSIVTRDLPPLIAALERMIPRK